jgi:hypothetical protein
MGITCTVLFSFGPKFVDKVTCDVTTMDCCDLFLGLTLSICLESPI